MTNRNENNGKQDICIAEIKKDCSWMKQEIGCIKTQVFNHLPHQIDDMRKERMEQIECLTKEITELKDKIMMSFLIGIVSVVVVQILLKLFY
jgi:hypothetical protein